MNWLLVFVAALIGYLFGAIPVGLWVCRLYGVDIRQVGSGRIGGTNAWRAAGLKAAIPTVLGDALKGVVAVLLARYVLVPESGTLQALAVSLAGGSAVWGHNWSIFIGFKGGAGGMTAAATAMAISPLAGGVVWIVGVLLIWWSRIASVATFAVGSSALAVFLMLGITDPNTPWPYLVFGIMAFVGIFIALRTNRERLKGGNERVITIW